MASTKEMKSVLLGNFANNPIALQILGVCSASCSNVEAREHLG